MEEWNKRLDERFQAQEMAVQFALAEREKAMSAALTAAKEAVGKAELAAADAFDRLTEALDKIQDVQSKIVGAVMLLAVLFPALTGTLYLLVR